MRRHKNLYCKIISFQNLLRAAKLAQRNKRFKPATVRFNFFLEKELCELQQELVEKSYRPGAYHHFFIHEPKKRLISAAAYRDRVVHHAIHNVLEPIFDPTFIYDSYATRKGKGTHAALDRFQKFSRKTKYALKCDIRQYFPSIDHAVLLSVIKRKIACPDTLWLIRTILDSSQGHDKNGNNFATDRQTDRQTDWDSYRQSHLPILCQHLFEYSGSLRERKPGLQALPALHG